MAVDCWFNDDGGCVCFSFFFFFDGSALGCWDAGTLGRWDAETLRGRWCPGMLLAAPLDAFGWGQAELPGRRFPSQSKSDRHRTMAAIGQLAGRRARHPRLHSEFCTGQGTAPLQQRPASITSPNAAEGPGRGRLPELPASHPVATGGCPVSTGHWTREFSGRRVCVHRPSQMPEFCRVASGRPHWLLLPVARCPLHAVPWLQTTGIRTYTTLRFATREAARGYPQYSS